MIHRLAIWILLGIASLSVSVASSTAQAVPQRVRVSAAVAQGLLESKVDPVYPPLARQARIQGTVMLTVHISKAGDVEDLQLVSGHPMLAPAAIRAVKQWKYRPFLLNGDPVAVETDIQVNFTLSDTPATDTAGDQPENRPSAEPGPPTGSDASAPPKPGVPTRIRVSSGVAQVLLTTKVNAIYPPEARNEHIQGAVVLQVGIDAQGNVDTVQLVSGHPMLAAAAIEAVKQWKYRPYLLNGKPLYVETQVLVNFTLGP